MLSKPANQETVEYGIIIEYTNDLASNTSASSKDGSLGKAIDYLDAENNVDRLE